MKKESSETLRKVTFNYTCFINNQLNSNTCNQFLSWFCGFTEGDGSLIVSKERMYFYLVQKDPKILYLIKKKLGFGYVRKHNQSYRYEVTNKQHIKLLYHLFNGNFILKKTQQKLLKWSQILELDYKRSIPLHNLFLFENSWLSGWIDAEGCFNSYWVKDSRYKIGGRIRHRFVIGQTDELEMLNKLQDTITSGSIQQYNNHYVYSLWGKKYQQELIKYLEKNKLRTLKRIDYLRWKRLIEKDKKMDIDRVKRLIEKLKSKSDMLMKIT